MFSPSSVIYSFITFHSLHKSSPNFTPWFPSSGPHEFSHFLNLKIKKMERVTKVISSPVIINIPYHYHLPVIILQLKNNNIVLLRLTLKIHNNSLPSTYVYINIVTYTYSVFQEEEEVEEGEEIEVKGSVSYYGKCL